MTTSHSPLRVLKAQAARIAAALKAAERGDANVTGLVGSLAAARAADPVTIAVVMDDKVLKIKIAWATIRATGEVGLAEFILKHMRGARETSH